MRKNDLFVRLNQNCILHYYCEKKYLHFKMHYTIIIVHKLYVGTDLDVLITV